MKKHKIILSILLTPFFLPFAEKQSINYANEDLWSGTVTFLEKRTGPDIAFQEWRMSAAYTDNKGNASNKIKKELVPGDKLECHGEGPSVLEVGIDEETKKYSILAYVPGCRGRAMSAAGREWETGEDETGIQVDNQPLASNRNVLAGSLVLRDSFPDGSRIVTTYTWNLRKK